MQINSNHKEYIQTNTINNILEKIKTKEYTQSNTLKINKLISTKLLKANTMQIVKNKML